MTRLPYGTADPFTLHFIRRHVKKLEFGDYVDCLICGVRPENRVCLLVQAETFTPSQMAARQDSDNLAWDRSDELWAEKRKEIRLKSTVAKIVALAERLFGELVASMSYTLFAWKALLVSPLYLCGCLAAPRHHFTKRKFIQKLQP